MKYRELREDLPAREAIAWWFLDSLLWPPNWFHNWTFKR